MNATLTVSGAEPGLKDKGEAVKPPAWKKAAAALWKGGKAFVFVVLAFAFWDLFAGLADFVVRRCEVTVWSLPVQTTCSGRPLSAWPDTIMLLTTLAVAIWAARRLVFPPDD